MSKTSVFLIKFRTIRVGVTIEKWTAVRAEGQKTAYDKVINECDEYGEAGVSIIDTRIISNEQELKLLEFMFPDTKAPKPLYLVSVEVRVRNADQIEWDYYPTSCVENAPSVDHAILFAVEKEKRTTAGIGGTAVADSSIQVPEEYEDIIRQSFPVIEWKQEEWEQEEHKL